MEEMIKKKKNETEIYLSLSHFSVGWKKKNVFFLFNNHPGKNERKKKKKKKR